MTDRSATMGTTPRATLGTSLFWLVVLFINSYISFYLRNFTDSLLLYLPNALAIALVHWYGWRVLPIIYLNALFTLSIWGAQGDWVRYLIVASHEPLVAATSKLLTDRFLRKPFKDLLSNSQSFLRFTFLGIALPIVVNSFYTYNYSWVGGDMEKVILLWLSDFITIFSLALFLLHFLEPSPSHIIKMKQERIDSVRAASKLFEFAGVVFAFVALSFFVPFGQYWFIYGIVAVVMGLRQGFEFVLIVNSAIVLINYILPLVESSTALVTTPGSTQLINVHLGNSTMLFLSTLVGRVVSDLWETEENLLKRKREIEKTNLQLNRTNRELDRFVYSVSHDLSAPLKSVRGLINISRMELKNDSAVPYLDKMEKSINRLEDFINEVLDYSRTNRQELVKEEVKLPALFQEVKEKFNYLDYFNKIQFITDFKKEAIATDRFLLKVIVSNLLSNAIKYQRKYTGHQPYVEMKSWEESGSTYLLVTDNGEGIPEAHHHRIFDMFYRGTDQSTGSGLGLYIAKEAVHKLGGSISFKSTYGEGSVFTVALRSSVVESRQ